MKTKVSAFKQFSRITPVRRDSPLPLYEQVKEWFYEAIRKGVLQPGMRLPSERELGHFFGVSRIVVRQAIQELAFEGLVIRKQGVGTFVAPPKVQEGLVQRLTGFFEDMKARGLEVKTKVTCFEEIPVGEPVAGYLRIPVGTPVYRLGRVRFIGGEPILYVVSYLPRELCEGLIKEDLSQDSLYELLERKYGLKIARGYRNIEAVLATAKEADLLGICKGDPLLLLRSITYLEGGRPLEYYEAKHRGDRCSFEVELVREERRDSRLDMTREEAFFEEDVLARDPEVGVIKVGIRRR